MAVPKEYGSPAEAHHELAINYEQKFPTAFAGRSLNRTDCTLTRDKMKALSQRHKKSAPVQRRMRFMQSHLSLRRSAVFVSKNFFSPAPLGGDGNHSCAIKFVVIRENEA